MHHPGSEQGKGARALAAAGLTSLILVLLSLGMGEHHRDTGSHSNATTTVSVALNPSLAAPNSTEFIDATDTQLILLGYVALICGVLSLVVWVSAALRTRAMARLLTRSRPERELLGLATVPLLVMCPSLVSLSISRT